MNFYVFIFLFFFVETLILLWKVINESDLTQSIVNIISQAFTVVLWLYNSEAVPLLNLISRKLRQKSATVLRNQLYCSRRNIVYLQADSNKVRRSSWELNILLAKWATEVESVWDVWRSTMSESISWTVFVHALHKSQNHKTLSTEFC